MHKMDLYMANNVQAKFSGFKENPSGVLLMQIYVNLLLGLCASKIFYVKYMSSD